MGIFYYFAAILQSNIRTKVQGLNALEFYFAVIFSDISIVLIFLLFAQ
jgi:hypothetical protein